MSKITCLHTPRSKFGPYTIVYQLGAWPKGTVKNRGWANARVVYEREATDAERAEIAESHRFISYRYKRWATVVSDEALYGIDANALAPREAKRAGADA